MKSFKLFFLLFAIFGLIFISTSALGKTLKKDPVETVGVKPVIDATTKATHRYLPVIFDSHDKHSTSFGIGCKQCHHEISDATKEPAACSDCHDQKDAKIDIKSAMHKSCKGCHQLALNKNAKSKAPVSCLGCHQERK